MNRRYSLAALAMVCIGTAAPGWLSAAQAGRNNRAQATWSESKPSAFSREPFTADMTILGRQGKYHGTMYAGRNALRTDVRLTNGATASVIVRYDKGVEWILVPGRHYIEAPIDKSADLLSSLRDKAAHVEKRDLGPEKVGAYPCEKYRVKVSVRGHELSGWIWVSRARAMHGFVVKAQDQVSGDGVELSHIQLKAPHPSLFDLPAGYRPLREASHPSGTPGPAH
ncbi:MAG TPA: hypothetical protein VNJ12_01000 [Candidatus Dormibacteraeota bacterium]|nr:hypothetical protein [Candidatus Dormibacteraeota bacterium]